MTNAPTETGFYWARISEEDSWEVVQVIEPERGPPLKAWLAGVSRAYDLDEFIAWQPRLTPPELRCPFYSRAYGVRCELDVGHEGDCANGGDEFVGGYTPPEPLPPCTKCGKPGHRCTISPPEQLKLSRVCSRCGTDCDDCGGSYQ